VAWLSSGSGSRIGAGEAISIEGGRAFNFPPSLNAVPVVLLEEHFGEPTENVLDKIGEVLPMIAINRGSNRILYLVSEAIQAAEKGDKAKAQQEIVLALASFDEIQRAEAAAEYGKWKHWYRGDWLTGIYRTRQLVETFSQFLHDPGAHITPPVLWDGWEAYYHIMHYEGDRAVDVN